MKTISFHKIAVLYIAALTLAVSASADVIGPWPNATTNLWDSAPIPTNASFNWNGTNYIYTNDLNPNFPPQYWFPVPTTTPKNADWLPYTVLDPLWAERLAVGRLILDTNSSPWGNSVHARIFDGAAGSGRHGWTITLRDNAGRILDFGIRGYFAAAQVKARQFDGTTNWTIPSGFMERNRTGNDYFVLDFALNPDNKIHWLVEKLEWDSVNLVFVPSFYSGDTTVAYEGISVVELGASTQNTTGVGTTYKWTEFSYFMYYKLNIALQSQDLLLSWATNLPPAVLQQAPTLPGTWSDVTNTPLVSGNLWTVTVTNDPAGGFFRLRPQ